MKIGDLIIVDAFIKEHKVKTIVGFIIDINEKNEVYIQYSSTWDRDYMYFESPILGCFSGMQHVPGEKYYSFHKKNILVSHKVFLLREPNLSKYKHYSCH